jgi:hypothetical protein
VDRRRVETLGHDDLLDLLDHLSEDRVRQIAGAERGQTR